MQDFTRMEHIERPNHLYKDRPDLLLVKLLVGLLLLNNFLVKVGVICEVHDEAQALSLVLKEGLFVPDDGFVLDRGQNADFVERIFFFFVGQLAHLYLFQCVDDTVAHAFDLKDFRVSPLAWTDVKLRTYQSWRESRSQSS